MVPQLTKAPAPRAVSYDFTTVTPLTTIYTPLATCSTGPITLWGGKCTSGTCTTWAPDQITSSWKAVVNNAYWNANSQMVGTTCAPPGSQFVQGFYFSPAVGCPVGYTTATTDYIYYSSSISAICCPSAYTEVDRLASGDWGCYSTISRPGQAMVVVAYDKGTSYDSYGGTYYYNSFSTISTTTINSIPTGTATPLWVYAAGVAMVVPKTLSAGATPTPTLTSTYPYDYPPNTTQLGFHIGPLTTTLSIIVSVAAGVVGFTILCCILCCCCCCRKSRKTYTPPPNVSSSYPTTYPSPHASSPSSYRPTNSFGASPVPALAPDLSGLARTERERLSRVEAAETRLEQARQERIKAEEAAERTRIETAIRAAETKRKAAEKLQAETALREQKAALLKAKEEERRKIQRQKEATGMKRNPERYFRLRVVWDVKDDGGRYVKFFDEGPTYEEPWFEVEGKTPLRNGGRKESRRPQTGLDFGVPVELEAASVLRPSSTAPEIPAETITPKKSTSHLPRDGPRLQVIPESNPISPISSPPPPPSLSTGSTRVSSTPAPTTQNTPFTTKKSRNTLPRDGPKFVVSKDGTLSSNVEVDSGASSPRGGDDGDGDGVAMALAEALRGMLERGGR